MAEHISLKFRDCTQNPLTCPALHDAAEQLDFIEQFQDPEPSVPNRREVLSSLVVACALGTCPGRDITLANQLVQMLREEDE